MSGKFSFIFRCSLCDIITMFFFTSSYSVCAVREKKIIIMLHVSLYSISTFLKTINNECIKVA